MNFPTCKLLETKRNPFTFFITNRDDKGKVTIDHTLVIHANNKRDAIEHIRSDQMYGSAVTFQVEDGNATAHPHTLGNENPIFWNQLRESLQH